MPCHAIASVTSAARRCPREAGVFWHSLLAFTLYADVHAPDRFATRPLYKQVEQAQFSLTTAENACKWGPIHPKQDQYTFEACDTIFAHARAAKQAVRGHNLCWHTENPSWLTNGNWNPSQLTTFLEVFTHTRTHPNTNASTRVHQPRGIQLHSQNSTLVILRRYCTDGCHRRNHTITFQCTITSALPTIHSTTPSPLHCQSYIPIHHHHCTIDHMITHAFQCTITVLAAPRTTLLR